MNQKVRLFLVFLILAIAGSNYALLARAENSQTDDQARLTQIESYYQTGKEDLQKSNYSSAIVNFNHVIELERNFNTIYTSYAQGFINTATAKIKENEEKELVQAGDQPAQKNEVAISSTPAAASPKNSGEYIIGTDDILFISVWQNKDLDQEVTVTPDGKIAVQLIGEAQAQGLTVSQLDQLLTEKFKEYLKYPEVSVTIRKIGGKKIILLGEVINPGVYTMTDKSSVLELIAKANGYTKDAVISSVVLIRGGLQKPVGYRLNLVKALKKGDLSQNMALEPEDIIYVPRTFISNVSYVMNQVLSPISQGLYTSQTIHHW